MSSNTTRTLLAAVTLLGFCGSAFAHAHLKASNPSAGASLKVSPTAISMTFTESLEPSFTGMELSDEKGAAIPLGDEAVSGSDAKSLVATIRQSLPAGRYHVAWHALSKDGHSTTGAMTSW
jgi:methionine-rich copper-binding protein CopC